MRLEFWYDVVCPQVWLAVTQVEALAQRQDAELVWRPISFPRLLGHLGRDVSEQVPAARSAADRVDLRRWADWYGIDLVLPDRPPDDTDLAMRVISATTDHRAAATWALAQACWGRGDSISDPEGVRRALEQARLPAEALLGAADEAAGRDSLAANTDEAHRRGLFGVPSFTVEDQLYWGQDRLRFVARALGGWRVDFVEDEDAQGEPQ